MEKRYKYLHVAMQGGGFLKDLTDTLADKPDITHPEEHLFITSSGKSGDVLAAMHNPACDVQRSDKNEIDIINENGADFDYIFVHGFHSPITEILKIRSRLDKKIIWRTWGHDIKIPTPNPTSILKTVYRYLMYFLFKRKVRRFYAVGASNIVDEIKVKKAFGNDIPILSIRYTGDKVNGVPILSVLENAKSSEEKRKGNIRILIGHSGIDTDDHINVLCKIKKFKEENITVTIPLSYGDPEYISKVKQYAIDTFGNKCEIIESKMPYEEYAGYIKSIDIAIFNMMNSAALGNVSLLAYYGKKIFVNKNGDLNSAFKASGIDCGIVDDIDGMNYEEFIRPSSNPEIMKKVICNPFNNSTVKQWCDTIDLLENNSRKKEK